MAVRRELNALDEISRNDRRNGERFTYRTMENRVFLPSYRYRSFISFPCRPKPRRPLASYNLRSMHRLTLQCRLYRENFSEIRDPLEICIPISKYESFVKQRVFKEKFFKKNSSVERPRKSWLCQINSFLFKTVTDVVVSGMIIGIFYIYFVYIIEEDINEKPNLA